MNHIKLLIIFLLSFTTLLAQTDDSEMFISEDEPDKTASVEQPKYLRTQLLVGSAFAMSGQDHFTLNTYIQPKIAYQISPRFEISMGLMAVQSNINNYTYYNYEGQSTSVNYNGVSAYYTLQGAYLLSENIKIYGGIMVGTKAMSFDKTSNQHQNINPKAYQLGMQYKLGDNSFIQLEFQFREGSHWGTDPMHRHNSFHMQPMSGFGTPDPFN